MKPDEFGFKGNSSLLDLKMPFDTNSQSPVTSLNLCRRQLAIRKHFWKHEKTGGGLESDLPTQCCHDLGVLACPPALPSVLLSGELSLPTRVWCLFLDMACLHHPCHSQQGNAKAKRDRSSRSSSPKHGPHPAHRDSLPYLAQV